MNEGEALRDIRGYAAAWRFEIKPHCWQRMSERGAQVEDVRHALMHATSCQHQPNSRWKVQGLDRDSDEMTLIVVIQDGLIIVTMF